MDRTLRSYLELADNTYDFLEKYFVAISDKNIEEKIVELQSSIKTIQAVAYQLAHVSNLAVRALHKRSKIDITPVDPYPKPTDIGTLRVLNPIESKEIVSGIKLPVKTVQTINDIPVSNIYYIEPLKQYAINIAGITIKGNLGNIVNYQCDQSAKCEYGTDCKSFKSQNKCPYWHDPEDFIYHKQEVPDTYKNFTVGSWIYSKTKTPKTYFARHIGSRDKIIYDLNTIKKVQFREEISNRENQLIHDLLIYMILNSRGLIERYAPWKKIPTTLMPTTPAVLQLDKR